MEIAELLIVILSGDPSGDANVTGDPFKTLFLGRIVRNKIVIMLLYRICLKILVHLTIFSSACVELRYS